MVEDLDADGAPEMVVSGPADSNSGSPGKIKALNTDGSTLWKLDLDEWSTAAGPVAFDFERDGRVEIVLATEDAIVILDGPTGQERWSMPRHSWTGLETPVIADVDGDGEAEILVSKGTLPSGETDVSKYTGILVLGSGEGTTWASARPVWNQFDYHQTNINDDGTLPFPETPHWLANNSVRSAVQPPLDPATAFKGDFPYDASVELVAACADRCASGEVSVHVRVLNTGHQALPAGLSVTVRRDGDEELLKATTLVDLVPKGWSSPVLSFTLPVADLAGRDLRVTVDEAGKAGDLIDECREDNNTLVVPNPGCGPE